MKIEPIGKFTAWNRWSFGFHCYRLGDWTLVLLFGTAWQFGLSRSDSAIGLCCGPCEEAERRWTIVKIKENLR